MENIETWTEKDPFEINGDITYCKAVCPHCHKSNNEEIEKDKFMNIGISQSEFICLSCKNKVNFSEEKLLHDQFGWHFENKRR